MSFMFYAKSYHPTPDILLELINKQHVKNTISQKHYLEKINQQMFYRSSSAIASGAGLLDTPRNRTINEEDPRFMIPSQFTVGTKSDTEDLLPALIPVMVSVCGSNVLLLYPRWLSRLPVKHSTFDMHVFVHSRLTCSLGNRFNKLGLRTVYMKIETVKLVCLQTNKFTITRITRSLETLPNYMAS